MQLLNLTMLAVQILFQECFIVPYANQDLVPIPTKVSAKLLQ